MKENQQGRFKKGVASDKDKNEKSNVWKSKERGIINYIKCYYSEKYLSHC
jgi:hypothetical protein